MKPSEGGVTTGLTTTTGSAQLAALHGAGANRGHPHRRFPHRHLVGLGVVLYAALAGNAPRHDIASIARLFVLLCTEPAPPIQDVAPWIPREMAAVVHRALQLKMDDRFQSTDEMLAAMLPLLPGGRTLREELLVAVTGRGARRAGAEARRRPRGAPRRSGEGRRGQPEQSTGGGGRGPAASASFGNPAASTSAGAARRRAPPRRGPGCRRSCSPSASPAQSRTSRRRARRTRAATPRRQRARRRRRRPMRPILRPPSRPPSSGGSSWPSRRGTRPSRWTGRPPRCATGSSESPVCSAAIIACASSARGPSGWRMSS